MITTEAIGRVLAGRYRIDAGIGAGTSSSVYLAFDTRLERRVAIKLLHPSLAGDAAFLRRFRAESQLVAQLTHPNVLQVYDWGEQAEGPFLVTEYLAGGSLRDLFDREQRLSVAQAVALGAQGAHALAYAHRRGLVHRDVKPANLLLDEHGGLRIADFGIARALAEAALTEPAGAVLGTARYASPEQVQGGALDGRSDVYALSLVIYEAVTGKVPFAADTTLATLMARVGASLPYRRELGPLYPLLAQATISDPIARFDAAELAVELDGLATTMARPEPLRLGPPRRLAPVRQATQAPGVGGGGAIGPTTAPVPALSPEGAAPQPSKTGRTNAARPRRRRRWAIGTLVTLAVLAAAGLVVWRKVIFNHRVPALVGMSEAGARRAVTAAGLRFGDATSSYSTRQPAGDVLSERPGPGAAVRAGTGVAVVVSRGPAPVRVPDVRAKSQAVAVAALRAASLGATVRSAYSETAKSGTVISESPASGTLLPGRAVVLVVSSGPSPRTIPDLPGATGTSFAAALRAERLVPVLSQSYSSSVPSGEVISTTPAEGATGIPVGTSVAVVVSRGPQLVAVPNVAGQPLNTAVSQLRAAGLDVTEVIGPPFATTAVTTDPAAGTEVALNSTLTLYAS